MVNPTIRALADIYSPSFYDRIGLRYVDVIDRASLGLSNVPWSELLNSTILGELSDHFIESNIEGIQKSIRVRNSDSKGGFLLQHGLSKSDVNAPGVYSIDCQFFGFKPPSLDGKRL
jgi:uncharacterized protein (TIGR04255 family)